MKQGIYTRIRDSTVKNCQGSNFVYTQSNFVGTSAAKVSAKSFRQWNEQSVLLLGVIVPIPLRSKIEINPAKKLRIYSNYHFYLYIYLFRY